MSFWDITIIIRYPEWSQLSNGYPGDVQVSTCVRSYGRNGNILKYYGSEKYIIVPLLHNKNELFYMICQIFVICTLNITFNTIILQKSL